jgi:hypothetical protein
MDSFTDGMYVTLLKLANALAKGNITAVKIEKLPIADCEPGTTVYSFTFGKAQPAPAFGKGPQ